MPYKYISPENRKSFLNDLSAKISKRMLWSIDYKQIPEEILLEISRVVLVMARDLLKVKNKYGYKVPLLVPELKYIRSNKQVSTVNILKINDYFMKTIVSVLEKEGDLFLHQEKSVPTIIQPLPWISEDIGGYYY